VGHDIVIDAGNARFTCYFIEKSSVLRIMTGRESNGDESNKRTQSCTHEIIFHV
jgi:hypothetical protein